MIRVLFFGQLTDITGTSSLEIPLPADTDSLFQVLRDKYPALGSSKFVIAVDKKQINENTVLHHKSSVVLMPPFSGG